MLRDNLSADPSPPELGRWLKDLTTRAVEEQMRTLQRYGELLRRIASGELDERRVGEETIRFLRSEAGRYANAVAALSVGYQNALLDLDRARNDEYFSMVLGEIEEPPPRDPSRVSVPLHGRVGTEVVTAFTVENTRDAEGKVVIEVADVTASDGTLFRAPVTVEPDSFALPGGAKQRVQVHLLLSDELFTPGQRYRVPVEVHGPDDLEVLLDIAVEEAVAIVVSPDDSEAPAPDDADASEPEPTEAAAAEASDPSADVAAQEGQGADA